MEKELLKKFGEKFPQLTDYEAVMLSIAISDAAKCPEFKKKYGFRGAENLQAAIVKVVAAN